MTGPTAARRAAHALLTAVLAARATLDGPEAEACLRRLAPEDRARAGRLAAAALRVAGRSDRLLAPLLRRRPPPAVRAALWLALAEVFTEGAPAHAAVNAAVDLAREAAGEGAAAFANAVLRRALAAGSGGGWARLPPGRLPAWLRRPLLAAWGGAVVAAIEAAHERAPPIDLTPRDPEGAAALAERLGARLLPTGSLRLPAGRQVTALPGHAEGQHWVQDAAAALPARLLAARPGARVLDLCAAPGGKTLQLAAAGARVTALDRSASRMARLAENLARCRLEADCVVADALAWEAAEPFDAVLLDAPCTATGTIRRHPELPLIRDGTDLPRLLALQSALIDRAVGFLRPGGRLVYAVCSLLPAEGEAQVAAALARHPGLAPLPEAVRGGWLDPGWIAGPGLLRTRPDHWGELGGLDGFCVACLIRRG